MNTGQIAADGGPEKPHPELVPPAPGGSPSQEEDQTSTPDEAAPPLNEPQATLYISNIDWSIKKAQLRRSLFALFSRHGKVLDVITFNKSNLKGQAWILFEDVSNATAALNAEQGFSFFGKKLKIDYAREKSDRVAKRDGTYMPVDRAARRLQKQREEEEAAGGTAAAEANGDENAAVPGAQPPPVDAQGVPLAPPPGTAGPPPQFAQPPPFMPPPPAGPPQQPPPQGLPLPSITNVAVSVVPAGDETNPPSNTLLADNLPLNCNEMMLAMLFRQYSGYKEVRIPRQGLALIVYENEAQATNALKNLNGFKLTPTETLKLKYAKT